MYVRRCQLHNQARKDASLGARVVDVEGVRIEALNNPHRLEATLVVQGNRWKYCWPPISLIGGLVSAEFVRVYALRSQIASLPLIRSSWKLNVNAF